MNIHPLSKRNGITLTIFGTIALTLGISLFLWNIGNFAIGLLFFSIGAILTLLGVAKQLEPNITLTLNNQGLNYFHRRGQVKINWGNIQRIDIPKVIHNGQWISLPYIGIKVKYFNEILDIIPPRLATGLLTEQRPLLMTASAQDDDIATLETYLGAEFTPLMVNDERYRGVLAMFGHRSLMLNKYLGYHLFIPFDSLDRDGVDFVRLLKKYKNDFDIVRAEAL
ncbi:DUF2982 domain-containing protein [Shewanella surugensis]|uniref:DUF2982 domain-containing protein n=1 Tax=Shewanella surugensis TaxID=212020 RepID=A0ABT0LB75_9GAMM|nr:DUF2982 domain-containing protein [Shewanella surugensis]MCL1124919.1 DUF2982 domain-containing protein [Shewanella surugensis]